MSGYHWIPQKCETCEIPPSTLLGRRGGSAHRQGLGLECSIWRCERCGLIFPNPMPVPAGGRYAHYDLDADEYFCHHNREVKTDSGVRLLQEASELCGRKEDLLEIGSGRGELLKAAALSGWRAVGIETSESFAKYASRFAQVEVCRQPIEQCAFPAESFDVVVLQAVLEHLYNPNETIREIARVLRPGGILYADVPNEEGLYVRLGNLYQRLRGRDWVIHLSPTFSPFHLFGFTLQSLTALLHKHGMQPIRWRTGGGQENLPVRGGFADKLERVSAKFISNLSNRIDMGTYLAVWSRKTVL